MVTHTLYGYHATDSCLLPSPLESPALLSPVERENIHAESFVYGTTGDVGKAAPDWWRHMGNCRER